MRKASFSVALGLTDYVNPIMYLITSFTVISKINSIMNLPSSIIYIIGVVFSLICGFSIPTIKLLIGMKKIKFRLPLTLVYYVNMGIFLSGLMLFLNIMKPSPLVFGLILLVTLIVMATIRIKTHKFNNTAVIIGAIGYMFIYISLISKSLGMNLVIPVILYIIAVCLYLMLVGIGIKGNLMSPKVHWVIEISNIICQSSVAIGTILLFTNI